MDTFTEVLFKYLSSDSPYQTGDAGTAIALIQIPDGALDDPYSGPHLEADYWAEVRELADGRSGDAPEPGNYVTYLSDQGIITWTGPLTRDDALYLFDQEVIAADAADAEDEDEEDE